MYQKEKVIEFITEQELVDFITTRAEITGSDPVGILAGHYILGYDRHSNSLMPLIREENNALQDLSSLVTEDFPLKTFIIGVELFRIFRTRKIVVRIVLLVNDHKFQDSDFQNGIEEMIKNKGGELRKAYYRGANPIPASFRDILQKSSLEESEVFLDNNDTKRNNEQTLPPAGYLFSEHILQKKFRRHTANQYINNSKFYIFGSDENKELRYNSKKINSDYCIVGNGRVGCTGIGIELLLEIIKKGIKNIILFIPVDCSDQINQASEVVLNLLEEEIRICIIENIENPEEKIKLHTHFYNLHG